MELSIVFGLPLLITGFLSVFYAILQFNNRGKPKDGSFPARDWNYFLKKFWAQRAIRGWKKSRGDDIKFNWETDSPRRLHDNKCDNLVFFGCNKDNVSLYISFTRRAYRISDLILILTLDDGTTYQLPSQPSTSYTNASTESWSAGGLTLTLLDAFRRWRIVFNGLLKTTNLNGEQELKHIRFNFVWIFAAKPLTMPGDCSDSLLADAVASKPWKNPYWMNEITQMKKKGYDQYGCFIGFIILDDAAGPQNTGLHGFRKRRWQPDTSSLKRSLCLFGTSIDGTVYIVELEFSENFALLKHGNVRTPNGKVSPIESIDMNFELFAQDHDLPNAFALKFSTKTRSFLVFITLNKKATKEYHGIKPEPWKSCMIPYQMGVNGFQGSGYLHMWHPTDEDFSSEPLPIGKHLSWLSLEDVEGKIPVCVTFKERAACCPDIVGGKGASLALLSSVVSNEFCVPNGFCLTSRALELQLKHNPELVNAIKDIENADHDVPFSIKDCCQRTTAIFEKTPVCDIVRCFIVDFYEKLCEKENKLHNDKIFVAVRSSGVGEDSEELSAAGQNTTILGCKTTEEVLIGVQKCWGSLYSFQSAEYRRQHGQPANCQMGVVIQVMVESEAAGVLFTKHPNNGNPKELLITSNYGLGESVVSGHVEPDSIIVAVDGDKLSIKSFEVGKKGEKIILDHSNNQQTMSVQMNEEDNKKKSISDEECLALARIGLEQEAMWGSPRDIEWAVVKGKIYLLQARPITCLNNWTEYELLHEMDTAVMSPDDLLSFANTGEVLPGAITPLTQSTVTEIFDRSINGVIEKDDDGDIRPLKTMSNTHYHIGLNLLNSLYRHPQKEITVEMKTMDIAICGHHVTDDKIMSVAKHRHGCGKMNYLMSIKSVLYPLWKNKERTKFCQELSNTFKVDLSKRSTASEMFEEIESHFDDLLIAGQCHTITSSASSASQVIFMSTILGKETDFTQENYQDIATILSSCSDVVSGDVPESLRKIVFAINESGKAQKFSELKPDVALEWMKENIPKAHSMLMTFLDKHGHRCIKEFDLMTVPWGLNPTPLLKTMQSSVNIPARENPPSLSTNELINKLVTPISNTAKRVLKFVIPICQMSVARRESTKAGNILILHRIRMAYRHMENQMIKEWRLPERGLIFMLTRTELQRLLKTRDPGLVVKAKLRKRYFPKWEKIEFNELNWGFPQPIIEDNSKLFLTNGNNDIVIRGTPVFSGDIVGRACVIKDIAKIDELENGDILITHSTDIGWSPYFPMLGGVVTELGGLISHGAVVAREYGLPCIVGAQGATGAFKTGDKVLLAASSGILKKVD